MSSIELYSSQKGKKCSSILYCFASAPGFLGCSPFIYFFFSGIDVIFQISQTSSKAGYREYILGFEPIRNGQIFWINYNSYWPLQKIPEHSIMLFFCHPKILHKHFLQFLLGVKIPPRETEEVWLLSSMSLKRPNNIKLERWNSRSN